MHPANEAQLFNPDPVLAAFASALAGKSLTPVVVKLILEAEHFYEKGKLKIAELAELLHREVGLLDAALVGRLDGAVEAATLNTELNYSPLEALRGVEALQQLLNMPAMQRARWKLALEGNCTIVSSIDPEAVRNLVYLDAYEQLTRLAHPKLNAPSIEYVRKCITQSVRKPSHRPSSGKVGERFRTAAVAAAMLLREAGASSPESWARVARQLNSADVRRARGAPFEGKTIENWWSKGTYSQHHCDGMLCLAKASPFRRRTRAQVAECALIVSAHFGKSASKNS